MDQECRQDVLRVARKRRSVQREVDRGRRKQGFRRNLGEEVIWMARKRETVRREVDGENVLLRWGRT